MKRADDTVWNCPLREEDVGLWGPGRVHPEPAVGRAGRRAQPTGAAVVRGKRQAREGLEESGRGRGAAGGAGRVGDVQRAAGRRPGHGTERHVPGHSFR